jgi:glycosyltransferase involved in cell wall biosynthesis
MRSTQLSVIIPIYNTAKFLQEAVASASRANEIILVDDASTDATPALTNELVQRAENIRLVRLEQNVGPGPARNVGLNHASGELIAFLDADDRYAPDGLELMCEQLLANPTADLIMGRVQALKSRHSSSASELFELTGGSVRIFQLGSCVIRKSMLERTGAFDPKYHHGEDIDWFFRAQEARARFELLEQVVLHHRRHDSNFSDKRGGDSDLAMVMAASLARRRKLAKNHGVPIDELYYIQPDAMRLEQ